MGITDTYFLFSLMSDLRVIPIHASILSIAIPTLASYQMQKFYLHSFNQPLEIAEEMNE